jgi:hypothetical protein
VLRGTARYAPSDMLPGAAAEVAIAATVTLAGGGIVALVATYAPIIGMIRTRPAVSVTVGTLGGIATLSVIGIGAGLPLALGWPPALLPHMTTDYFLSMTQVASSVGLVRPVPFPDHYVPAWVRMVGQLIPVWPVGAALAIAAAHVASHRVAAPLVAILAATGYGGALLYVVTAGLATMAATSPIPV